MKENQTNLNRVAPIDTLTGVYWISFIYLLSIVHCTEMLKLYLRFLLSQKDLFMLLKLICLWEHADRFISIDSRMLHMLSTHLNCETQLHVSRFGWEISSMGINRKVHAWPPTLSEENTSVSKKRPVFCFKSGLNISDANFGPFGFK